MDSKNTSRTSPQKDSGSKRRVRSRGGLTGIVGSSQPLQLRCRYADCLFKPKNPQDLRAHLDEVHFRPRKCRDCSFVARSQDELDQHRGDEHSSAGAWSYALKSRGLPSNAASPTAQNTSGGSNAPSPSAYTGYPTFESIPEGFFQNVVLSPITAQGTSQQPFLAGPSGGPPVVASNAFNAPRFNGQNPYIQPQVEPRTIYPKQLLAQHIIYFVKEGTIPVPNPIKFWACQQLLGPNCTELNLAQFCDVNDLPLPDHLQAYVRHVLGKNPGPKQLHLKVGPPQVSLTVKLVDELLSRSVFNQVPGHAVRVFVPLLREYLSPGIYRTLADSMDTTMDQAGPSTVETNTVQDASIAEPTGIQQGVDEAEWSFMQDLKMLAASIPDLPDQSTGPPAAPSEASYLTSLIDMDLSTAPNLQPAGSSANDSPAQQSPEKNPDELDWGDVFSGYGFTE